MQITVRINGVLTPTVNCVLSHILKLVEVDKKVKRRNVK